jgi:hypothetical protein
MNGFQSDFDQWAQHHSELIFSSATLSSSDFVNDEIIFHFDNFLAEQCGRRLPRPILGRMSNVQTDAELRMEKGNKKHKNLSYKTNLVVNY